MKTIICILFTFVSLTIRCQTYNQFFDGFNTNPSNSIIVGIQTSSTNIWQIGAPQKTMFNSASTLPKVIITDTINTYPINNVSTFTFAVKNTASGFPYALQWKQKLDMDAGLDGGIIEISMNSGNTWQNVHNNPNVYQFYGFLPSSKDTINGNEYCFSGTDNVWRDIWLCLPTVLTNLNDTIYYKFTFKSDGINTNKEGWMIDNMNAHNTIIHPVKEISQIDNIVVYPNITNGIVNVEMKKTANTDVIQNIELYNSEGKLVESYGQNYTKVVLDISKHKAGMYYLNVTINKKVSKFKILYEKN